MLSFFLYFTSSLLDDFSRHSWYFCYFIGHHVESDYCRYLSTTCAEITPTFRGELKTWKKSILLFGPIEATKTITKYVIIITSFVYFRFSIQRLKITIHYFLTINMKSHFCWTPIKVYQFPFWAVIYVIKFSREICRDT